MGDLVLKGATSGQITVTPTAIAGTNTLTLPARTGNIITSADSGTVTQAMLASNVAGNGPAFYAYRSGTDQTGLTSGASTKVQLNSVASPGFNIGNFFDATTNYRFTPNVAGYYQISASTYVQGTGLTFPQPQIRINGNTYAVGVTNNVTYSEFISPATALAYLNGSTDYLELWVFSNTSSGTFSVRNGSTFTYMTGVLVRAA